MSAPKLDNIVSDVPLFDVTVRLAKGMRAEEVERLGVEAAGMPAANVANLVKALRAGPTVKVGSKVSRERADQAAVTLAKAGLAVDITPVLAISAVEAVQDDGKIECPACNVRVLLPENRQCPSCLVYVDKITDEFLLKKRLLEQERRKLDYMASKEAKEAERLAREQMEKALREQIRKELEKEYGVGPEHGLFKGKPGKIRAAALAGLLVVAFGGGHLLSSAIGSSSRSAAAARAAENAPKVATIDAEGSTGDADIDDPLIQAARGKRGQGQGISIEQAIAASQTLAKSVGQSVPGSAPAGATAQGGKAGQSAGAIGPGSAGASQGAGTAGGTAGADVTAADAVAGPKVSVLSKLLLKTDFSKALAEIGQLARAKEVIAELKKSSAVTAERTAAVAVQIADLEIDAWSLLPLAGRRVNQGLDGLKASAAAMTDPALRAQALSRAGVILVRHAQLPASVSRDLLKLAGDSLAAIRDPAQRSAVQGDWSVAMGEALSSESTSGARVAVWSKAQAAAAEVDGMIKKAPDEWSQARLYAIDHQLRGKLGQSDRAQQSLDAALALVNKIASLPERLAKLRTIAQLAGTTAIDRINAAIAMAQPEAESKAGMEKAQALTHLALLHADAGSRGKADQVGQLARSTPELSPADSVIIGTELVVRGDMAAAKALHAAGLYSEAEKMLQRLAGYLL